MFFPFLKSGKRSPFFLLLRSIFTPTGGGYTNLRIFRFPLLNIPQITILPPQVGVHTPFMGLNPRRFPLSVVFRITIPESGIVFSAFPPLP